MIRSTLLTVGLLAHLTAADTLLVPEEYPTIQDAVEAAEEVEGYIRIQIGPGTFDASNVMSSKSLFLRGTTDKAGNRMTILSAGNAESCFISDPVNNLGSIGVTDLKLINYTDSCLVAPSVAVVNCEFSSGQSTPVRSVLQTEGLVSSLSIYSSIFDNTIISGTSSYSAEIARSTFRQDFEISIQSPWPIFLYDCVFQGDGSIALDSESSLDFGPIILGQSMVSLSSRGNVNVFGDFVGTCQMSIDSADSIALVSGNFYPNETLTSQITANCSGFLGSFIHGQVGIQVLSDVPSGYTSITNCRFNGANVALTSNSELISIGDSTFSNSEIGLRNLGVGTALFNDCRCCRVETPVVGAYESDGLSNWPFCPTGSCCIGDQCISQSETNCEVMGGEFIAADLGCDDFQCDPTAEYGFCCVNESPVLLYDNVCQRLGGTFLGMINPIDIECPRESCAEDVNGDAFVDFSDLLEVISAWGPCSG